MSVVKVHCHWRFVLNFGCHSFDNFFFCLTRYWHILSTFGQIARQNFTSSRQNSTSLRQNLISSKPISKILTRPVVENTPIPYNLHSKRTSTFGLNALKYFEDFSLKCS